ncbi:MAG: hypothetical protein HZB54_05595 [Deltaproteobacteria bacterium]|nr:hypothetical protein [Deltaproteobacteria bacterium]
MKPLNIAFLWHMHQPLYKDPFTGEYILPWVRLHGTKDYYDMVAILEDFPSLHQTFNLVPSLIEQINDYADGRASDKFLNLTLKPPSDLTLEDKVFIVNNFFLANWECMIRPFHGYWELLKKRGFYHHEEDMDNTLRYFSEQDFMDLQVLFNLAWIDTSIRETDRFLKGLVEKGRGFTEEDKEKLIAKQQDIIKRILPKYREMEEKGIVEISTSPYYHPILPLLCDSHSAKMAMLGVELPQKRFTCPEDAVEQVRRGIKLHQETFGRKPKGMWPSEGSVSEAVVPIMANQGINWIATDEEILENSLGRVIRRDSSGHCLDPAILYKPYHTEAGEKKLSIVFRDHVLSDLVGFVYTTWKAEKAAEDFIGRLSKIHDSLEDPEACLVSIILDGENAWEYYKNDGRDFLTALYARLSNNQLFKLVTVSEHLNNHPSKDQLPMLYSGSWINHNFKIWIGHSEDNTAWDYLKDARDALIEYENRLKVKGERLEGEEANKIALAWQEIYAAEGSDWFWWYGDEHSSMSDKEFDELFRKHIKKVYFLIGKEPPLSLDVPIMLEEKLYEPSVKPTAFINPFIDGEISNYFEWLSAGRLERTDYGVAMHREARGGIVDSISYGFNVKSLFLRFDYLHVIVPYKQKWEMFINFLYPKMIRIKISVEGEKVDAKMLEKDSATGEFVEKKKMESVAAKDVVEFEIQFKTLGVKEGDEMRFFITVDGGERGLERWPSKGYLAIAAPSEDFEDYNWWV